MLSHFDFCFGLKINVTFVSLSFSFWLVLFDFFYIQQWSCHLILLFPGLCMVIVFLSVFIAVLKSFITFVFDFFLFPLFLSIFFSCYPLPFCWALLTCVAIFFSYMQVSIFVQLFLPDCSCLPLFAKPKRFANVCCCFVLTTFWVMHFCLAGFFAMTKRFLMLVLSQLFVPVECDSYFLCISLSFCDSQWSLLSVL